MNKQIIPLSFLADYVSKEETGYQVANELVEIAHGKEDKKTLFLIDEISKAKEAVVVEKKDYTHNSCFADIANWCEPTDVLVLLDTGVMLLFPKHKDDSHPTFSKLIKQLAA